MPLPPTLFKQWQRKIGEPTHAAGALHRKKSMRK